MIPLLRMAGSAGFFLFLQPAGWLFGCLLHVCSPQVVWQLDSLVFINKFRERTNLLINVVLS